ncbi:MAG: acetolactate synthase large subunit [Robiginitomaculum sp.]|nr:MAG: acetolactate synthase large subunit [Robiginitomaculum sp.]
MFAAESLVRTLVHQGVELCFSNPGTSEMHMVAALDRTEGMKSVLCLFEGVATGAADGYARMSRKPACTLLHLGPGVGNGLANLHNAKRAFSPVLNIVGDHAGYHLPFDAPLTSDVEGTCAPVSRWVGTVPSASELSNMAVKAVQESFGPAPGVASLILPADCAWSDIEPDVLDTVEMPSLNAVATKHIQKAAKALKSAKNPVLYIGGTACLEGGIHEAARIGKHLDCRVVMETFAPRISRGAGRPAPTRLNYFGAQALEDLKDCDLLLVAGSKPPVSFFAYPNSPSELTPEGAAVFTLGGPSDDIEGALLLLANALDAGTPDIVSQTSMPLTNPDEALNPVSIGMSLCRHMPQNSVVCDDSTTAGLALFPTTQTAAAHEWLCLTGGAIGIGMPMAIGAAFAAPSSTIFALCGDGAAAYTLQALWTQAREKQNIINIVFVNHSYRVLNIELSRVGAGEPGPVAQAMLDLSNPKMDWVKLSEGFGVPAVHANTTGAFEEALLHALATPGPHLIAAEV